MEETPPFEHRQATDAEAKALASGLRLRMLRLCLDEPLTNREIAEALGLNPASCLHHVRTLVDTGFLVALEPRRGRRGSREIPYRTTGKSWYLDSPAPGVHMLEAFLQEVQSVPPEHQAMTRLGLKLKPAELDEFRERLQSLFAEYHDRPRDPDGEAWSLFVAFHPDTSQPRDTGQPTGRVSGSPSSTSDDEASPGLR